VQPLLDYAEPLAREGLESLELPEGETSSPLGNDAPKRCSHPMWTSTSTTPGRSKLPPWAFPLTVPGWKLAKFVEPKAGSALEEFLAAQKKGTLSLARYLEPTPWLVIDGRMQKQEMLIELYRKFFDLFGGVLDEIDTEKNGKKQSIWRS